MTRETTGNETRTGFLFVADISGFTGYLNDSELEHAQGTLTELMQILVDKAGPPLRVSKLEGDAVFSYAFSEAVASGQTFVELVEDTYVAFRRAIELMVLNNSCTCNACSNVSSLDLKFMIHHGSFLIQHIGQYDELLGSDVNLLHRLMKNNVVEETGVVAYCLYTAASIDALELEGMDGLLVHSESVPDFGEMKTWVQDLRPVYEERRDEGTVDLMDDEVLVTTEAEFGLSAPELWTYVSDPAFRSFLLGSASQEITDLTGGRTGVGSTYVCYHGGQQVPQLILAWEPFSKVVTKETWLKPWKATSLSVVTLTETSSGTRMTKKIGQVEASRIVGSIANVFMKTVMTNYHAGLMKNFKEAVEADWGQASSDEKRPLITDASIREAAIAGLSMRDLS